MGEKVQIYIYDLSRGMARSLGPAIIGKYAILQLIAIKMDQNSRVFSLYTCLVSSYVW
jgi:hypothetical protein